MAKRAKTEDKEQEKPITLRDFRAWLQGVEDMQEEEWTPTAEQWKRIRHKINLISVTDSHGQMEISKPSELKTVTTAKTKTPNFPQAAPPKVTMSTLDSAASVVAAKGGLKVEDGRIKTPSDLTGEKYTTEKSPFV